VRIEGAPDADNPRAAAPAVEACVPEGGALVDVCDDTLAPVPFSCKSANCGTCRVEVLEGADELLPPNDDELEVLHLFGAPRGVRLACQAKMKPGLARLHVRVLSRGSAGGR
jgi:ferredoxin